MKIIHGLTGLFSRLGIALLFVGGSTVCMALVTDISQAELLQRIKTNKPVLTQTGPDTGRTQSGRIC